MRARPQFNTPKRKRGCKTSASSTASTTAPSHSGASRHTGKLSKATSPADTTSSAISSPRLTAVTTRGMPSLSVR